MSAAFIASALRLITMTTAGTAISTPVEAAASGRPGSARGRIIISAVRKSRWCTGFGGSDGGETLGLGRWR
ncbi:hypothetical protein BZA05DRAFT_400112 [Tricharina praecox]|uniref:uncharacterized protein n=1 Tax=Tricharina praecox TaxID=43433 RepID=UPI00221FE9F9|nr:uncharacterized protein BZA05DRAFT_400112 [Tricharina praecox]KAI5850729.1 hypothetical protein BZA05DRAFT_400112 [Tricharina praecox]